jgi:hypothetical protein
MEVASAGRLAWGAVVRAGTGPAALCGVEVGSGLRSAADGAALYDKDVKKQAQQLGLKGWD